MDLKDLASHAPEAPLEHAVRPVIGVVATPNIVDKAARVATACVILGESHPILESADLLLATTLAMVPLLIMGTVAQQMASGENLT